MHWQCQQMWRVDMQFLYSITNVHVNNRVVSTYSHDPQCVIIHRTVSFSYFLLMQTRPCQPPALVNVCEREPTFCTFWPGHSSSVFGADCIGSIDMNSWIHSYLAQRKCALMHPWSRSFCEQHRLPSCFDLSCVCVCIRCGHALNYDSYKSHRPISGMCLVCDFHNFREGFRAGL